PRQRQVMELVFFEELTFKEIAEQTQQTFGNVRNQYYRGLKRLRAHLSASSREDRGQTLAAFDTGGTEMSPGDVQFDSGAFADELMSVGEADFGQLKMSSS